MLQSLLMCVIYFCICFLLLKIFNAKTSNMLNAIISMIAVSIGTLATIFSIQITVLSIAAIFNAMFVLHDYHKKKLWDWLGIIGFLFSIIGLILI